MRLLCCCFCIIDDGTAHYWAKTDCRKLRPGEKRPKGDWDLIGNSRKVVRTRTFDEGLSIRAECLLRRKSKARSTHTDMTRTFRLALTAVLSLAVVIPAIAQDNFPDVPDNHWAYEALKRMKSEGLLVGYPDGLFRGNRPATRYELAVAVHATYVHLRNMIDNLNSQIAAIQDQ